MSLPAYLITGITARGLDDYERAVKQTGQQSPANVSVTIHGSTLGQLNLGQVFGNIQTTLTAVQGSGADEFRTAIEQVTAAVRASQLPEDVQAEALDHLDYLSQAAASPPQRRPGVLKAVLERLPQLLAVTDQAHNVWNQWSGTIQGFFAR